MGHDEVVGRWPVQYRDVLHFYNFSLNIMRGRQQIKSEAHKASMTPSVVRAHLQTYLDLLKKQHMTKK